MVYTIEGFGCVQKTQINATAQSLVSVDDFFHHIYSGVRTMLFLKTKLVFVGINKQFDPF